MGRGGAQKLHKNLTEIIKISRALAGVENCVAYHGELREEKKILAFSENPFSY